MGVTALVMVQIMLRAERCKSEVVCACWVRLPQYRGVIHSRQWDQQASALVVCLVLGACDVALRDPLATHALSLGGALVAEALEGADVQGHTQLGVLQAALVVVPHADGDRRARLREQRGRRCNK